MMELVTPQVDKKRDIALGAEAYVYEGLFLNIPVICKERLSKEFRDPAIDYKLRKERTTQEVRIMQLAHGNDLPVPRILDVDKETWTIIMEKVDAKPLRDVLDRVDIPTLFGTIGEIIAKFHNLDIIHGDLTTSNILYKDRRVYFIDFGLGYISTQIEDRAVDLLVLKHILESSHSSISKAAFSAIIEGYTNVNKDAQVVRDRLDVVENRVRYRSHGVE